MPLGTLFGFCKLILDRIKASSCCLVVLLSFSLMICISSWLISAKGRDVGCVKRSSWNEVLV